MERRSVKSNAIRSVGYRDSDFTLEIEFCSGRIYQYSGVPRSLYEWMLRSTSQGGFFNRMIWDKYPEVEVTPVQEQDLLLALRASVRSEEEQRD